MEKQLTSSSVTSKATGPRTAEGKRRSRRNSTKYGILADEHFLLECESAAEFRSLRQDLRQYFRPEGSMEDLLVEKLASLY